MAYIIIIITIIIISLPGAAFIVPAADDNKTGLPSPPHRAVMSTGRIRSQIPNEFFRPFRSRSRPL